MDSLWLDATEPEALPNRDAMLYMGSGNLLMNPYSLFVTSAIHDGLANDYPERRIFSLTRSSYAGQQRTGAVVWSGDIAGAWDSLAKQV